MVACLSAAMSGSTDPGKQVIPSSGAEDPNSNVTNRKTTPCKGRDAR
jgi:hypothetical protein